MPLLTPARAPRFFPQLVEAQAGLQAVIRALQVAQSRGIKTVDAPSTDGEIAILWGDAGVAAEEGKLAE